MTNIAGNIYRIASVVDTSGFSKLQKQILLSTKQLDKMKTESKLVFDQFKKGGKESATRAQMLEKELEDINRELLKQYNLTGNANKAVVKGLKERQKLANAELQTMKAVNNAHVQGMGDIIAKVGKFMVATAVLSGFTTAIYKTVEAVFELDKSLTELRKVSDMSDESVKGFTNRAFELGQTLGKTGAQVVDAVTEFSKAGYSINESLKLAETALLFQNIADEELSVGEASSFVISQMKAFNITAGDSVKIVDKINEISNKYAVSSGQLSQNIGKVASAVASTGVTYDELLSLMTAGTEVNRNASKTANAIKTVSVRLARMDEEANLPKLEEDFNAFGLSMVRTDGYTKTVFESLKDLAPVFKQIKEAGTPEQTNRMNALLEGIGGVYNISALKDILTNFDTANKVLITSLNSAGSAAQENEKYMQSLEARVNLLNSAFSKLANDTVDSGVIKFFITATTEIIKFLDATKILLPLMAALAAGAIPAIITGLAGLNASLVATGVSLGIATGGFSLLFAALAGGVTMLALWTNSAGDINKEIAKNNENLQTQISAFDGLHQGAQGYLDVIASLNKQESLSTEEKQKMKFAIDGLNSVIPNLNAGIDETNGKLKGSVSELQNATDGYINLAKAQLYQAMIEENATKIAKLEMKKADAEEQKRAITAKGLGPRAIVYARNKANIDVTSADRDIIAYKQNMDEMIAEYGKLGLSIPSPDLGDDEDLGGGSSGGVATEAIKSAKEALDDYIKSLEVELDLMEQRGESEESRIEFMKKIQEEIHNQANYYRALGLSETASEIQSLKTMWWKYEKDIATIKRESLQKQASNMESAFAYVVDKASQEIEKLESKKKTVEDFWDAKISALKEENDLIEDNIALQQAQAALAQAKANKIRVFKDGKFVYTEDVTAVSEAQSNLDNLNREKQLKDEVSRLETLKKQATDNIDSQIKKWSDYSKKWASVASDYKTSQDKLLAEQVLGINTESANWQERLGFAASFVAQYNALMAQIGGAAVSGTGAGGGGSSYVYDITTKKGQSIASNLGSGQTYKATDGSTWKKNTDGSLSVTTKSGNTYAGKYAKGTTSASAGLANVDEQGQELILRRPSSGRLTHMEKGDGVIPSGMTQNLMDWGRFNPQSFVANMANGGGSSETYAIDKLVLPNVTNANELVNGLKTLKNQAIQISKSRK